LAFSFSEVLVRRERLSFFFLATSVQAQEPGAVKDHTQQNGEVGSIPTGDAALRLVHSTGAACQAHRPVCTVGVLILDGVFMWFALGLAASAWGARFLRFRNVHMWCMSMHIEFFNTSHDIDVREG